MPIIDLQRSLRRLGRIRMGRQLTSRNGKPYPAKLEQWRLTSQSADLLEAAAELYGGKVQPWEGAPGPGRQFELFTESPSLDITIPPGDMAFSQWYEMWSGGGCQRRCDGQTEQLTGEPCMCPVDAEERQKLAGKGEACKPTTRLFVILHRVPDIGMWHLESHGYYAAVELAGSIEVLRLAVAAGHMPQAVLRIDQRSVKRAGETLNYAVPVIELPGLTAHTLMTGEVPMGALEAERPALPAAPAEQPASPRASEPAPKPEAAAKKTAPPRRQTPAADSSAKPSSAFHRAIRQAWKRDGTGDEAELCALTTLIAGRERVEQIEGPEEANNVMKAIGDVARGALVLRYEEDGQVLWDRAVGRDEQPSMLAETAS